MGRRDEKYRASAREAGIDPGDMNIAKAMASAVKNPDGKAARAMGEYFDPIESTLERLVGDIRQLRAESLRYRGVWAGRTVEYKQGDCATHAGTLWTVTVATTRATPGRSDDWQMLNKSH
jgi:hypothetical protein